MGPRPKLAGERVVMSWPGKWVFSQAVSKLVLSIVPHSLDSPGSQAGVLLKSTAAPCCLSLPWTPAKKKKREVCASQQAAGCNSVTGKCSQALHFPCSHAGKSSAILHDTWFSGISTSPRFWTNCYSFPLQSLFSVCLCWQSFISSSAFPYFFPSFCSLFCLQLLFIMLLVLLLTFCECIWNCFM